MSPGEPVYRVVIVDDVAALRRLVKIAIENSRRFKVEAEASTGAEALEVVRRVRPDLVLLDLSMPELDGLEALPRVLELSPQSRVAILSGFNHARMAPIALRLGASAYLEKGLAPNALVRELLKVMEYGVSAATAGGPALPAAPGVAAAPPSGVDLRRSIRVLGIVPDPALAQRLAEMMADAPGASFRPEFVRTLAKGVERLDSEAPPDVVLLDPLLPGADGAAAVVETLAHAPRTPIVVLSRDGNQSENAMKLGVEDVLPLAEIDSGLLARSLLYAMERRQGHKVRQAAREQVAEMARLRELERMKTQFFNTAAHELFTPLTPIKVQLHLLKSMEKGGLAPEQRRSLEILDRNVDRLSRLTQDLLDVARLQAGRLQLKTQSLSLADLVGEVAETFEPVAMAQGVALETRTTTPGIVEGDPKRVAQVLYNLVSNAVKFTPRGGRVTLDFEETPKEVLVRVRDTGIGLSREQMERLFQPFSRVHEATEAAGGTGLGLYVSKALAELHGGRVWCESEGAGKGATFTVAFPVHVAVPPETAEADAPVGAK